VNAQTWDVSQRYPVTFRDCITMMFVDAIWMGVLSWYIAKVWPSEFGTQQPFYFLCLPSYWKSFFGISSLREVQPEVGLMASDVNTEEVTENLKRQIEEGTCVDIRDLYKVFNTTNGQKVAVDGLNLTMYSGQVTALLGHNGAGKVTSRFVCSFNIYVWVKGSCSLIEPGIFRDDMPSICRLFDCSIFTCPLFFSPVLSSTILSSRVLPCPILFFPVPLLPQSSAQCCSDLCSPLHTR
jgi:hypothetical protein